MLYKSFFFCFFASLLLSFRADAQWTTQTSGVTFNLNCIWFVNPDTGFCAGNGSTVLKTTNGGSQWLPLTITSNINFNYIKFFNRDSGIVGCHNTDSFYVTVNGGSNWTLREINTAYYSSGRNINFPDFNNGYYFSGGDMYYTNNNGVNWSSRYLPFGLKSMSFINSQTGWICGTWTNPYPPPYGTNYSEVWKTVNGGLNWTAQISVQELSYSIYRVFFKDASTGFYNDFSSGCMRKTMNGGSSYSSQPEFGSYLNYYTMNFSSNNNGWFLGQKLLKTTNGASNWTEVIPPQTASAYSGMFFINELTGWLTGQTGKIIKTTTGGVVTVRNISTEIPNGFKLYQNYPNPFNSMTNVKWSMLNSGNAKIIIYDIMGKEVETILNEYKSPGTYQIRYNAGNLSSGIYFYKLTTGEFSETKKFLLVK